MKDDTMYNELLIEHHDDIEQVQLVGTKLGDEEYAIDVLKIQEIIRTVEITIVPRMEGYILGVMNLRGKVIPVIDLRIRFGLSSNEFDKSTRIIVVRFEKQNVGFVVDAVTEVVRIDKNMVEPSPQLVSSVGQEYILGICKFNERLIMLLDIDRVVGDSGDLNESELRKKVLGSSKPVSALPMIEAAPTPAPLPEPTTSIDDEIAQELAKREAETEELNKRKAEEKSGDALDIDAEIAKELAKREAETEELNKRKAEEKSGDALDIDAEIAKELAKREAETEELNKRKAIENSATEEKKIAEIANFDSEELKAERKAIIEAEIAKELAKREVETEELIKRKTEEALIEQKAIIEAEVAKELARRDAEAAEINKIKEEAKAEQKAIIEEELAKELAKIDAETEETIKRKTEEIKAEQQAIIEAEVAKEIAKREAEEQANREVEAKAKQEAEAQAKLEAEEKAKQEAEAKAKLEAEEKAKQELEAQAKLEAEEKAKQEAEAKAKLEAEAKAKQEAEAQAKLEAEEKAKQEAEAQAQVIREIEEQAAIEAEKIASALAGESAPQDDDSDLLTEVLADAMSQSESLFKDNEIHIDQDDLDDLISKELAKREAETDELNKKNREEAAGDKKNFVIDVEKGIGDELYVVPTDDVFDNERLSIQDLKAIAKKIISGEYGEDISSNIKGEIGELLKLIHDTKSKVDEIAPTLEDSKNEIPVVTNYLHEINKDTENATASMFSSTNSLMAFYDNLMNDVETLKTLLTKDKVTEFTALYNKILQDLKDAQDIGTHLLEALEFQDITEQKLRKAIKSIEGMGQRIGKIVGFLYVQNSKEENLNRDKLLADFGLS